MEKYNPKDIEKKWQRYWEEHKTFEVSEDEAKKKFYALTEFPYPSGVGLHVGHPRPFTAMDVISRKKRMDGMNVLYPIGFDAFGLPTENYAIKTRRPPAEVTAENIATFTRQLKSLGYSFDWSRVVDTTDPAYYRWTQWIFLQLFKQGLAYKKNMPINWCVNCKIGLANEEVVDGACERCGGEVVKKDKEQWMLRITQYADSLLDGLNDVDYIERAKVQQENWIGKSQGALVKFEIRNSKFGIDVFTTRPDTLFGATYMVLAPEHKLVEELRGEIENADEVEDYLKRAKLKSDLERTELQKEKTGVELKGVKAVNPVNEEEIPIFVADYVLASYGTGAIMAVPAHDERDFEFAKKYCLEIRPIILPMSGSGEDSNKARIEEIIDKSPFLGDGKYINSDFLVTKVGHGIEKGIQQMIQWLEENGVGKREVNFKLRDWVFSRQRYWGEPIPLVHCDACAGKGKNYVFIHGYGASGSDTFRSVLREKLETEGKEVFSPDLPNTDKPNVEEQAEYLLDQADFNENTVIVAHSLGGSVAFRVLEKLTKQISKVVLVDTVLKPEFNDTPRPDVEASDNFEFNFEKIKVSAEEFVIVADSSYGIIKEKHVKEMKGFLEAKLIVEAPTEGHFCGNNEPVVENEVLGGGWQAIPESELPLELPKVEKYEPTDTGESPLSKVEEWVNTTCPKCGGEARRETDVMPNWAGSSWYFLRYCDPKNDEALASPEKLKYWMNVDWYNGGMEHTVLHLLYSRFWNQFLFDIGVVPTKEPYKKRTSHGMILAEDGEKMSKSRGNVVNPDDMVERFGTDAFRLYIMFMGPFDQAVAWDTNGLKGMRRFLDKVWMIQEKIGKNNLTTDGFFHRVIKKVGEDIEEMKFNTAIAKMMELVNEIQGEEHVSVEQYESLIKILSPFSPHICEELWAQLGHAETIAYEPWPEYDESKIVDDMITLVLQVNGKVRASIEVSADISEDDAKKLALENDRIIEWLNGKEPKKVIYVKGKLVSIVV
ncbi:MAG: leucine--tRNA ligase [Candidatus Magasanikbacteria bacterium]